MNGSAAKAEGPRESIEWRHAEMRSVPRGKLDPELAKRAAQLDAAALVKIRDKSERADVAVDMGYAGQAQAAYRHELGKHPEVASYVDETFERHRRDVWDKELCKARELASMGHFPNDERARKDLDLDKEFAAMQAASAFALQRIADQSQRAAFLESVSARVFADPGALHKAPAAKNRDTEPKRQKRDRGDGERERVR